MMKKNAFLSLLLAAVMLLSLSALGSRTALAAGTETANDEASAAAAMSDVDTQLSLFVSKMDEMKQNDQKSTWYYTVTDLDHDGNLEFVAASLHPADRSTNLKVWEVSADRSKLEACSLKKDEDESFPDIMTDSVDTFHDTEKDTWSYLVYDNIVISDTEVYTIKTSVSLEDGVISYVPYAVEHTVLNNSYRNVSHTDANGFPISPEQYNASGVNAFAGAERSSTSFDWFTADDTSKLSRLADSYSVFTGAKEPTEVFPVPKPAALQHPEATPTPVPSAAPVPTPTPAPAAKPAYLMITKNPTNENRKGGETALFVACANAFDSLSWTLVAPDGGEYSVQYFGYMFADAPISGEYSTTLSIGNVAWDMNGWGAYCTFYYNGQTARTSTAYLYVKESSQPTPAPEPATRDSGVYYGSVIDWTYSTVTVNVEGVTQVTIDWSLCDMTGEVYYGAPATLYWENMTARGPSNYTWCSIEGSRPDPEPSYGSMSGVAYHDTAFTVYVVLADGSSWSVDGNRVNIFGGNEIEGAPCTVYYTDYPSADNIYQIDIYGYDPDPEPEYEEPVISTVDEPISFAPTSDPDYDPVGDEYHRVECQNCGNHFSMGEIACPVCGWSP